VRLQIASRPLHRLFRPTSGRPDDGALDTFPFKTGCREAPAFGSGLVQQTGRSGASRCLSDYTPRWASALRLREQAARRINAYLF